MIFELAKKYYPTLWDADRIRLLVGRGLLTAEQYEEITGKPLSEGVV